MTAKSIKKNVSLADGKRITVEACSWNGTPYTLNGQGAVKGRGGDCSGSTYRIYAAVRFPYTYQSTGTFEAYAVASGLFRILDAGESKQDGDVLLWNDHMAIYSSFSSSIEQPFATTARTNAHGQNWTQTNDMWTAYKVDGPPYGAAEMKFFKPAPPKIFRCQSQT
jgi:hypothetical protein